MATVEVPEECGLTLYPVGRVEADTRDGQDEDEMVFTAECQCGRWESEEITCPIGSVETQARAAWLEHLQGEEKEKA